MVETIKSYELNENASVELLNYLHFSIDYETDKNGTFEAKKVISLYDDIYLTITILRDNNGIITFNDRFNINVWDADFGVKYSPFYNSKTHFLFLDNVVERYNEEMDKLCSFGLFNEVDNKKKLILM